MRKILWTKDDVQIEPFKDNTFAFHFQNPKDKRKIILGGRGAVGLEFFIDALIVLEEPEGRGDIHKIKFDKIEFWVQIHNAPRICMTKDIGRFLGSIIGEVIGVDGGGGDLGSHGMEFLRVWVLLEIDKPLRRCLRVDVMGDGVESVMLLKYERLPDFCFRCGYLGHTVKECPVKPLVSPGETKEVFLFSSWMRAFMTNRRPGNWGSRWDSKVGNGMSSQLMRDKGN
ncbi:hypothetical protein Q3G72_021208 [Acer saccharum]|nr:hypothetical protein Q3G72_021208 [Acer saccharum]